MKIVECRRGSRDYCHLAEELCVVKEAYDENGELIGDPNEIILLCKRKKGDGRCDFSKIFESGL